MTDPSNSFEISHDLSGDVRSGLDARWSERLAALPDATVTLNGYFVEDPAVVNLQQYAPAEPECGVFWGSHGCDLPPGHDGDHVCDCEHSVDAQGSDGSFTWDLYGR